MAKLAIETRQLCKRFDQVTALEAMDLQILQGEFVAIMGASGSGKTTLLNILTCLDSATSGQVLLQGTDVSQLDEAARRAFRADKIGLVFQQFHLIPYLSVVENVMLAQHYHSLVDREAALAVLDEVGLSHRVDHLPRQLSGGEQQRVCIARALVNAPPIIFADEPTGNLDEENERIILKLFQGLHRQGRTIVMVTHNPELGQYTDRVIRLQHGQYQGEQKNMMQLSWIKALSIALGMFLLCGCSEPQFAVGAPALPLKLVDRQGQSVVLDNVKPKVALLYFWSSSCGACLASLSKLNDFAMQAMQDVQVIMVHQDIPSVSMQAIAKRYQLKHMILARDRLGVTQARYHIEGYPSFILIDRQGIVRSSYQGAHALAQIEKDIAQL